MSLSGLGMVLARPILSSHWTRVCIHSAYPCRRHSRAFGVTTALQRFTAGHCFQIQRASHEKGFPFRGPFSGNKYSISTISGSCGQSSSSTSPDHHSNWKEWMCHGGLFLSVVALICVVLERPVLVASMAVPSTSAVNRNSWSNNDRNELSRHQSKSEDPVKKNSQPSIILPNHGLGAPHLAAWTPHLSVWSKLLASNHLNLENHPKSAIYTDAWDTQDDHIKVANRISNQIKRSFKGKTNTLRFDIISSMEKFMEFCNEHLESDAIAGYQLKLSVMHGAHGTQCPAYHVDNVPVRWIETLHGPGTVYIDSKKYPYRGLLQNMVDNARPRDFEGLSTSLWKEAVINSLSIAPSQTRTGQAALLPGRRWSEVAKSEYLQREVVLHRSPTDVEKSQGRVLLVLDVMTKSRLGCSEGCCH